MPTADHRAGDRKRMAAAIMEPAAQRLRACSHLYFELELNPAARVVAQVRHYRTADVALADYGDHVFETDPLTLPFRSWLDAREAHRHAPSIVALGEIPHTARARYENRFLHRAGIHDVLGLGIPVTIGGRAKVLCFGFHRRATDPCFGQGERRILEQMIGTLRLQAENLALHDAASRLEAVSNALSHTPGWVLLDDRFRLLDANERGRSALSQAGEHERILVKLGPHRLGLTARKPGKDQAEALSLGRSGDGADVSATPLQDGDGKMRWLLQWQVDQRAGSRTALLLEAGVSARERQIVELLAAGYANPGMADHLGISVHTVENHLRSIFAKLGVSTRTQMLSKLLSA